MNLVLTNAVLLPLAILVLVPLILHLFARARPPVYPFSSVEFLRRIVRQSIRLKKPQSLLVLLLRTLLFAALIGLFLRPVLFGHHPLPGAGVRRNVVIVMDATASMAAVEGTQTRFALACAKASDILAQLSSSDLADIVWLGTPNHAEFPQLSLNREYLKKALRNASVGYEAADIPAGLAMAADLLQGHEGSREIFLLSDFQASAWQGFRPSLPENTKLVALKIGEKPISNQAITSIHTDPPTPLVGQEVKIFCEIHNFSPDHALTTLFLRSSETRETREIQLPPNQTTTAIFQLKYQSPGEQPIAVSLSEDAFPYDNQRWSVINVVDHLKVGLFNGEKETADYWRRAVDSLGWAKTELLSETRLQEPISSDLLLLAGWNPTPAAVQQIQAYLNRGGLVIWAPPMQSTWTNFAWMQLTPSAGIAPSVVWEKATQPWRLRVNDPEFPALKIFEGGLYGDPARGQFLGRLKFTEASIKPGKVVLSFDDQIPALVHFGSNGDLFLWNLPLQREFSDWAAQSEFLPFFGELILQNRKAAANAVLPEWLPGMALTREFEGQVLDTDVRLQTGNDVFPLKRESTRSGVAFTSENIRQPGIYEWACRGQSVGRETVNFPNVESDLSTLPGLAGNSGTVINLSAQDSVKELREGTPLWPLLLGLALVAALLEGLVLWRIDKP